MTRGISSMSRSSYFLFISIVLSLVFSQLFFYQLDGHEAATFLLRVISVNHIVAEFLFMAGLLGLLVNGKLLFRLVGYLLFMLLVLVYSFQYASLFISGDYLSPTAIDNVQHIGLILSPGKTAILTVLGVFLLALVIAGECYFKAASKIRTALVLLCCIALAVLLRADVYWLGKDLLAARAGLYHSGVNSSDSASPMQVFTQSLGRTWQSVQKRRPLSKAELRELTKFGLVYDEQKEYPLIKDYIYQADLPFQQRADRRDTGTDFNVIVFLSEGLSARVMQPYSDAYPGLTPNIAEFATSAMRVDNYYNHTFATYRALLGQLCSIFPVLAGGQINADTDYYCLGDLFNEEGYDSYFLFSQQKQKTKLDEVLAKSNISQILAQKDLSDLYLDGKAGKRPLALSDQQFLQATIAHLRSQEEMQNSGDQTPFFIGLYNIETHAYYEASDDGVEYEGYDSYILDSIHNYDDAFGKFWAYFQQSSLFENTIVIFTTDHTHFQGQDFIGLVNKQPDYKPLFVDRIPLLIYHPGLELPAVFDANYASSIDLAPTIAQLMKFDNRSNPFLGRSIFDRVANEALAYGEDHIYLIDSGGIEVQNEYFVQPVNDTRINQMYKVINNFHALETEGRIWNRGNDD